MLNVNYCCTDAVCLCVWIARFCVTLSRRAESVSTTVIAGFPHTLSRRYCVDSVAWQRDREDGLRWRQHPEACWDGETEEERREGKRSQHSSDCWPWWHGMIEPWPTRRGYEVVGDQIIQKMVTLCHTLELFMCLRRGVRLLGAFTRPFYWRLSSVIPSHTVSLRSQA